MLFLRSCEQFHRLMIAMLQMTSWLLQNIGALILASLVWLDLKTGLVLGSFGLFDRHPHIVCASLFILGLLLSCWLVRRFQRRRRVPQHTDLFSSSPYKHRRTQTPEFPPGMQFNLVQERWRKRGMEEPFLKRRAFGASRPMEVPPVRRPLLSIPTVASRLPQSDRSPINTSFGKVGWS
jgi:hypothetical protein